jgi:hypothetical protein
MSANVHSERILNLKKFFYLDGFGPLACALKSEI